MRWRRRTGPAPRCRGGRSISSLSSAWWFSFTMVMRHEVGERPPQMASTERDDAIEPFFSDRACDPLRVRIAIGRQERCPNQLDARRREDALDGCAPLSVAIADQQAILVESAIHIVGELAHHLDHERLVR